MTDLIDRIELMRQIAEFGREIPKDQVMEVIARVPSADRPKGEWKCMSDCGVTECDQCGWSIEEYVGDYNFCPNCGTDMSGEVIGTEMPLQKWIPVSERLPREGQKCLVCHKGAIGIDEFIGHDLPYKWRIYLRDYDAWMSLPEPYEGGEDK